MEWIFFIVIFVLILIIIEWIQENRKKIIFISIAVGATAILLLAFLMTESSYVGVSIQYFLGGLILISLIFLIVALYFKSDD